MSTEGNKNFENQEIDLISVSKNVSSFFKSVNRRIFLMIQFVLKNIVVLGILLTVGLVIGFYLDQTQKTYKNSIIVRPNFESTDYLYSKIEFLNSKIKDNDTLFLKAIGIQHPSKLMNIEVSPIIDIYKFISSTSTKDNDQNFQLLKLLAEDGDMNKIVTEKTTSKNYTYHKITFNTKGLITRKEIIEPLLDYLENNPYYKEMQRIYLNNLRTKIVANQEIVKQIDGLLDGFKKENSEVSKKDKLVYYNENTQLNDIINTKNNLIGEIGRFQLDIQTLEEVIKENSSIINVHNTKSINGKFKLVIPLVLIFGYLFINFFIRFYRKQASIYGQK